MPARPPYQGLQRKLVIAFDVGTTFCGVSYSILDPGIPPETYGVVRFPAQMNGYSKIPSVLYYDSRGVAQKIGAEAAQDGIEQTAEDNGWTKASWFKLHLRPKEKETEYMNDILPALPPGVTVVDAFADLFRYLYRCTKTFFEESHASGRTLWASLEKETNFVLTHPNGWGGPQQQEMKKAAIKAGLVPDMTAANAKLSFVTEGEASLHSCICSGLSRDAFKGGKGVVIVDAGGGTIDISAYAQSSGSGNRFEEIAATKCLVKGSIFVTNEAERFIRKHLRGSDFSTEEDIKLIVAKFDKDSKLTFRHSEDPLYIQFGGPRDNDRSKGIQKGTLKLKGSDVAGFFAPSLKCITEAISDMRQNAKKPISSVFLVGGFGGSDYLYNQIIEALASSGIDVSRPEEHFNKAVANGAVSYYIDHYVDKRVVKSTYGHSCSYAYNPSDLEHQKRRAEVYEDASGTKRVPGVFDVIVNKDTQVSEATEFRRPYWFTQAKREDLPSYVKLDVLSHRGSIAQPHWMDVDKNSYVQFCIVEADTAKLRQLTQPLVARGKAYYEMHFEIILTLGLTQYQAEVAWKENGKEVRGPASIVYHPLDD